MRYPRGGTIVIADVANSWSCCAQEDLMHNKWLWPCHTQACEFCGPPLAHQTCNLVCGKVRIIYSLDCTFDSYVCYLLWSQDIAISKLASIDWSPSCVVSQGAQCSSKMKTFSWPDSRGYRNAQHVNVSLQSWVEGMETTISWSQEPTARMHMLMHATIAA